MKKSAFRTILDEHKNRVFSYAFYVLRNREDAEDVTQEVFIKLWQNLEKIDENRYVGWIMRVAHNQCISLARKRKTSFDYREESDRMAAITLLEQGKITSSPELACESSELTRTLLFALEKLSAKTRSIMILHYFHGMKYRTIGEIAEMNVNTIKVEVHRGRKKLREILANEFPERVKNS